MGCVHDTSSAPTYTPVVAGDTRVTGYYNRTSSLKLELAGRYNAGAMNPQVFSLFPDSTD
ncbi:MAG: hypothetical protein PUB22_01405 [Clostridiales bacterium]|nr:hypothetical protein [Clostridiales bacterium]